jgi:hypothetical protein
MTWTTPRTWVAGETVTAAIMNTHIRDNLNYVYATPICVLSNSAVQSIANATITAVTFDTEGIDTDNMHSTVTNTSRMTAVTAGWYSVSGTLPYQANATGSRWMAFQVNGSASSRLGFSQILSTGGASDTALSSTALVFLNVGDYVEMVTNQNSTVALNIDTANGGARLSALAVHA